jgi:predicted phosphodiesterase
VNSGKLLIVASVLLVTSGCVEFSPFETDLRDDEQDWTEANLERLRDTPPPHGAWKLAAISDSHSGYEELAELVEIFNERGDISLVLHAGDMTDFGLRQEYRWSLEQLSRLEMPWLTVIGNHDALSNGPGVYAHMFGPLDYSFEWGGVRFVCFNSNRLEFGSDVPDWDWVEAKSVAPEGGGTVILTHIPPWAPELSAEERFAEIAALPGMLLSLHGHLHGGSARALGPAPSVVVGTAESYHHVIVTIDGESVQIERCQKRSCAPLEVLP